MGRLKSFLCAAYCMLLALLAPAALAESFQRNLDAIDKAANSVLLLEIYDANEQYLGSGSGFVAFDENTLITNHHVMEDADFLVAYSDDGDYFVIDRVIAVDEKRDIAILDFDSAITFLPLELETQQASRRGEPVVAIGSPQGIKNTISMGVISTLHHIDGVSHIQFTAPISPGSSGGALFNDQGRVIGITSSSYTKGQNLNQAVTINHVIQLYHENYENEPMTLSAFRERIHRAEADTTQRPTHTPEPKETVAPAASPTPGGPPLGQGESRVFDNAGLFGKEEIGQLEKAAAGFRADYQMDIVILTTNDAAINNSQKHAGDFYQRNGFGIGSEASGLIFMIDMKNAVAAVYASGQMSRYLNNARLNGLLSTASKYLQDGRYSVAAGMTIVSLRSYMAGGIPKDPQGESINADAYVIPFSTPAPTATPTPSPTATPAADGQTHKLIDLKAMWTRDGVILRWEHVPHAKSFEIYRWEDDQAIYLDSRGQGTTYFMDRLADMEDLTYEYQLAVVYSDDGEDYGYSKTATAISSMEHKQDLMPPSSVEANVDQRGALLAWSSVHGADMYGVFRSNAKEGPYFPVVWINQTSFVDYLAEPGQCYYYKVRSVSGNWFSAMSEPVLMEAPKAAPRVSPAAEDEPEYPLIIGEHGYIGSYLGSPWLAPLLHNTSKQRTILGMALTYHCQDNMRNPILYEDSGQAYYTQWYPLALVPGQAAYPAMAWLYGMKNVKHVNVAVSAIVFEDGSVLDVPQEKWVYGFWTMP